MPRWLNLPNSLTLLRLALVPFVIQAVAGGHHTLALALFAAAAVTDVADGAAARWSGAVTPTGAYLDPIADKCLLNGVFLALAIAAVVPWWIVWIVFARDIAIVAGALLLMRFGSARRFPPSVWGKISTFAQIVTAVSWMATDVLRTPSAAAFSSAMLWPCAGFTIWSGIHYAWRSSRPGVWIDANSRRE